MHFPMLVGEEGLLAAIHPAGILAAFLWRKMSLFMTFPVSFADQDFFAAIYPAGILHAFLDRKMGLFMTFQVRFFDERFSTMLHGAKKGWRLASRSVLLPIEAPITPPLTHALF